jgi:hypothetical protein
LEEVAVYSGYRRHHANLLIWMEENRASRGVKLSSVTCVGLGDSYGDMRNVFRFREHVTRVEFWVDHEPEWSHVPARAVMRASRFGELFSFMFWFMGPTALAVSLGPNIWDPSVSVTVISVCTYISECLPAV